MDPFTLDVIQDSLTAIGDQMFYVLGRSSQSPIIYEVLDYACGLTDGKGQLIAQGNGVTGFLGCLSSAVQDSLVRYADRLLPGDVIMTNDPYSGGGTHLSDVALLMPIFHAEQIVAFAVNKAHWTEVGGKDAGSWTTDATEVYQEGIQLPFIKIFDQGVINDAVVDIIRANVRLPAMTLGDMWAQMAALRVGAQLVGDLIQRHGWHLIDSAIQLLLDRGEKATRQSLKEIPPGIYAAEDAIDDDGLGNGPFEVKVQVVIGEDGTMICDFTGSHAQVPGPVNTARSGLISGLRTIITAITHPELPANEGVFRPLEVICPDGTLFTAQRPAAVSTYWETMEYVTDLVWKALAPALPDRLPSGHFLSVCGTVLSGHHPDSGELYLLVEPQVGGWGASASGDGPSGQFCVGDGETYNLPVEIAENRYGITVEKYAFNEAPGGAGRFRGGRGVVRTYRLSAPALLTATFGRHHFPAWSVDHADQGTPNYVEVVRADGTHETPFGKVARLSLDAGDRVRLVTGHGGGWGLPAERDPDMLASDVRNGFVSTEEWQAVYRQPLDKMTEKPAGTCAEC